MENINQNAVAAAINEILSHDSAKAAQKKATVRRWEATGMLEGIGVANDPKETARRKLNLAQLYDNEIVGIKDILRMQAMGHRVLSPPNANIFLNESTPTNVTQTSANREAWSNVAFPIVRKVFAELFAQELVSVQAMDMPTSYIFYLDYKFGTNKPENFNSAKYLYSQSDSLYGNTTASGDPTGRWYGGGTDYSFTRNYVSFSVIGINPPETASWADVDYDADLSASVATQVQILKIGIPLSSFSAVTTSASLATNSPEAILLTSGSAIKAQYRRFNRYNSAAASVSFIISGSVTGTLADCGLPTVEYLQATSETVRGDFEAGQTFVGTIPELKIEIRRENVTAETRRLKTTWSEEDAQDLEAYQGVSVEETFVDIMAKVIGQETDLQILNELRNSAVDVMYWSRQLGYYVNKTTGAAISGAPAFYGTQEQWYTTLFERIADMSNLMHKRNLQGGATHLVVSTEVSTILELSGMRGGSSGIEGPESLTYSAGFASYIGTLRNQWKVFKSPFVPSNEIMLVRKGADWLDTGYVWAPYIPLTYTDTLVDPDNFSLVRGAMRRDASKVIKPEYVSRIIISHMNVA